MMSNKFSIKNINLDFLYFFVIFSLIWLSLGSTLSNIYFFDFSFSSLINFLRSISNIIIVFLIFFLIFYKGNFRRYYQTPGILILFFFLLQITFLKDKEYEVIFSNIFNIENLLIILKNIKYGIRFNALSTFFVGLSLVLFFQIYHQNNSNFYKALVTTILIYLFSNLIYTLILFFNYYTNDKLVIFYYTQQIKFGFYLLENVMPRSTGLARSLAILSIVLLLSHLSLKQFKFKSIVLVSITIMNVLIFLLMSRFSIYCLILSYLIIGLVINKNVKNYLLIIFLIVVPYLSSKSIITYKTKNYLENNNYSELPDKAKTFSKVKKQKQIENYNLDIYSSGRLTIWKELKNIYLNNNSKIIGLGHLSDRRYLYNNENVNNFFGSNASNGYVYALVSSGIIGLFLIIILNIYLLIKILTLIKKEKTMITNLKENLLINCSIMIFIVLNLRMLVENSYTVLGADLILFMGSIYIIINKIKLNKII